MKSLLFLVAISFVFVQCTSKEKAYEIPPQAITIMSYNVENLFDTQDDPGKKDETYLPLAKKTNPKHIEGCKSISNKWYRKSCLEMDWSKVRLKEKMKRLADVILRVKNGKGPDVLILEEVENKRVLSQFNKDYLGKAGYDQVILIEGPDKRGIDVGMLARLPLMGKAKLHQVKLDGRPTRGILEARFKLPDGTPLSVFGVHFPSQHNPTPARLQAIQTLNHIKTKLMKPDQLAVVGGDFNISAKEEKSAKLYQEKLGKNWLISHQIGCKNCPGTHNYRGKWSFLDALLFSRNLAQDTGKWKVVTESIRVETPSPLQTDEKGLPARFRLGAKSIGVSDHWPIVAEIVPLAPVVE